MIDIFLQNDLRCHVIGCAKDSVLLLLLNQFGVRFLLDLRITILFLSFVLRLDAFKEGARSLAQALGHKALLSWLRENELLLHLPLSLKIEIVVVGHHIFDELFFLFSQEVLNSKMLENVLFQLLISFIKILLLWL